jgi:nitrous oxidase accessory protein NosD
MSYTLRGRIESRFAGWIPAFLVAIAATGWTRVWWPVELAVVMLGVGLACDVVLYHRPLDYQPGWATLPLGAFELGLVMALAHAIPIMAPVRPAIALFAVGWVSGLVLGQAVLPMLRWSYAEDGGELGRAGPALAFAAAGLVAAAGGVAWVSQPPTVYLSAGVHRGPIVIDRTETLIGRPGAVIRGGLVIKADNVTVRNVTVVGGQNGVTVEGATGVMLDRVHVRGAELDGFHVRRAQVMIEDCSVRGMVSRFAQGIDISFTFDQPMSMVEGCRIRGGQEGIVSDSARVMVERNTVTRTTLRGITVTEMSMSSVEDNHVDDGLGIGIFCADQAECLIADNRVAGTRSDPTSADLSRLGYAIVAHSAATAFLEANRVAHNPHGIGVFAGGFVRRGGSGFSTTM